MKKLFTNFGFRSISGCCILIVLSFASTTLQAQVNCASGIFYAVGSDLKVHELTLSGNTVVLNSAVTPAYSSSLFGLGISNLGGSLTFFSCGSGNTVLKYSGSTWQVIATSANLILNGSGNNTKVYYQNLRVPNFGSMYENRIDSYDGTTFTTLWADSTIYTTVSDIAADDNGNVYYFTGNTINDQADHLNVISSSGTLIASLPVNIDCSNAYGLMILDSVLYIGLGSSNITSPNTILPVTISGGIAVTGTPIPVPHPAIGSGPNGPTYLEFTDMASCSSAGIELGLSDFHTPGDIALYTDPSADFLFINLKNNNNTVLEVIDMSGRKVLTENLNEGFSKIDIHYLSAGIYIAKVISKKILMTRKFLK